MGSSLHQKTLHGRRLCRLHSGGEVASGSLGGLLHMDNHIRSEASVETTSSGAARDMLGSCLRRAEDRVRLLYARSTRRRIP